MKIFIIFIILIVPLISNADLKSYFQDKYGKDWIDVVFDIDGTLAFRTPYMKPDFKIQGEPYVYANGAAEFLAALAQMDARVTFFSAGPHDRNEEIAHLLEDKVEKLVHLTPQYTILSRDLVSLDGDKVGKKNLKMLPSQNLDLDRTILIDDHPYVPYEGQERNLLPIYYDILDLFRSAETPTEEVEQLEQIRLKNNLVRAAGILLTILNRAKDQKTSIVSELQLLKSSDPMKLEEETNTKEIYDLGSTLFSHVNPDFKLYTEKSLFSGKELFPYSKVQVAKPTQPEPPKLPHRVLKKIIKKLDTKAVHHHLKGKPYCQPTKPAY